MVLFENLLLWPVLGDARNFLRMNDNDLSRIGQLFCNLCADISQPLTRYSMRMVFPHIKMSIDYPVLYETWI